MKKLSEILDHVISDMVDENGDCFANNEDGHRPRLTQLDLPKEVVPDDGPIGWAHLRLDVIVPFRMNTTEVDMEVPTERSP